MAIAEVLISVFCAVLRSRRPAREHVLGLRPEIGNETGPAQTICERGDRALVIVL